LQIEEIAPRSNLQFTILNLQFPILKGTSP
jgi:hypothetical protein